jgi:hypothetical protein
MHISLHVVHNNLPLQCTKQEVLLTKNEKILKTKKENQKPKIIVRQKGA